MPGGAPKHASLGGELAVLVGSGSGMVTFAEAERPCCPEPRGNFGAGQRHGAARA